MVKAIYENSFCMDSDCINYFEDMCLLAMEGKNTDIKPYKDLARDSTDCKEFKAGTFMQYAIENEDIPFSYNECEECIYTENLQDKIVELEIKIDELMKEKTNYRCLAVLEELELENQILQKENMSLKKVLAELVRENKECRDVIERFKSRIE